MAIKALSLKQSMNKNVQAIMPQEDEKAEFEKKLISYLETLQAKKTESEEYQKNLISDFLKALLQKNFINTSNRIDLAIYNGQGSTSSLGVIIEVKSLTNKSEMMTRENINAKALRETVAYYMGERFSGNLEIKKAIITNGLSWFIIELKSLKNISTIIKSFMIYMINGKKVSFQAQKQIFCTVKLLPQKLTEPQIRALRLLTLTLLTLQLPRIQ